MKYVKNGYSFIHRVVLASTAVVACSLVGHAQSEPPLPMVVADYSERGIVPVGKPAPSLTVGQMMSALPQATDLRGYEKMSSSKTLFESGYQLATIEFGGWRREDKLGVNVVVYLARNLPSTEILTYNLATVERLPQGSLTGRRMGERSWKNAEGDYLVVRDGFCVIVAYLICPLVGQPGEPKVRYQATREDRYLIERLVSQTLDRLTVLGLTSRPKEEAPEFARKQMAERMKATPADARTGP
jgi:hypothetical protein